MQCIAMTQLLDYWILQGFSNLYHWVVCRLNSARELLCDLFILVIDR